VQGSPGDVLQERTIELSETAEQAVVAKEARVTEEVVVRKNIGEHSERIDDTVRHTEVEIQDDRSTPR
jgi:stress response protein YsnF